MDSFNQCIHRIFQGILHSIFLYFPCKMILAIFTVANSLLLRCSWYNYKFIVFTRLMGLGTNPSLMRWYLPPLSSCITSRFTRLRVVSTKLWRFRIRVRRASPKGNCINELAILRNPYSLNFSLLNPYPHHSVLESWYCQVYSSTFSCSESIMSLPIVHKWVCDCAHSSERDSCHYRHHIITRTTIHQSQHPI